MADAPQAHPAANGNGNGASQRTLHIVELHEVKTINNVLINELS